MAAHSADATPNCAINRNRVPLGRGTCTALPLYVSKWTIKCSGRNGGTLCGVTLGERDEPPARSTLTPFHYHNGNYIARYHPPKTRVTLINIIIILIINGITANASLRDR
uniref:Uncharacterized protein n=1 Tax=Anopheles merus TaxID=30066 RepID=A0A182UYR9_ANOME